MSIRTKFTLLIGVLSLAATVCIAVFSYKFSVNSALAEAKSKGELLFNYIDASRTYFRNNQQPLVKDLVENDRFYPELMSGFVLTRGVWEKFSEKVKDYQFKQATEDPLYPPNKADQQELAIIADFRTNPSLNNSEGLIDKDGRQFFYFARPVRVEGNCLHCHGEPADAPKDQIEIYGAENGYHWTTGETVAALVIYVPMQQAFDSAKSTAMALFFIGTGGVALLMLIIWLFFSRRVVAPLVMIEERATEISLGKNLGKPLSVKTKDEIGVLARAIDRLRISMDKMLRRSGEK